MQGNGSNRTQSTTSLALADQNTQKSTTTGMDSSQNYFYSLSSNQEQEGSLATVTGMLKIFALDVYALLDPRTSLSFIDPYVVVKFISISKTPR